MGVCFIAHAQRATPLSTIIATSSLQLNSIASLACNEASYSRGSVGCWTLPLPGSGQGDGSGDGKWLAMKCMQKQLFW